MPKLPVRLTIRGYISDETVNPDKLLDITPQTMAQAAKDVDRHFTFNRLTTFDTEGAAGTGRWKPLTERYAKWKRKVKPGRRILEFSGRLKHSLVFSSDPQHIARAARLAANTWLLSWGTANTLAAYHGPGRFHNPDLPIRDAMGVSRRQAFDMIDALRRSLARSTSKRLERAVRAAQTQIPGR